MGYWSNLPIDLLVSIGKYTTIGDQVCLPAVCTHWGALLKDGRFPSSKEELPSVPWLLIPMENPRCGFFNISEVKMYYQDIPEAYTSRCCGTSDGWMIMTGLTPSVFMFNPLTRSRIELPPLTTLPHVVDYCPSNIDEEYTTNHGMTFIGTRDEDVIHNLEGMKTLGILKAVLSRNPCLEKDHIVMVSYSEFGKLGFCRRGDDKWTKVKNQRQSGFVDMIYWKEAFYIISCEGRLFRCNFDGPDPVLETIISSWSPNFSGIHNYLAVSEGELLRVIRKYEDFDQEIFEDMVHCGGHCVGVENQENTYNGVDDGDREGTSRFIVYKADLEKNAWKRVKDLGNQILFVGINTSMSFDVRDFPGCKRNHIYFTNDHNSAGMDLYSWEKDLGAMDLKTCKLSPFPGCSGLTSSTKGIPIWMKPSLF